MQPASTQTNPEPGSSAQGDVRCSRCGRGNAADAKFCAGCGIVLTKAAEATGEALDASLGADVFKPLPKRDPQFAFRVAVASGVLVMVVAGAAYYLYRNFLFVDFSPAFTRSMPPDTSRMGVMPGPVDTGRVTPGKEGIGSTPAAKDEAPVVPSESAEPARSESAEPPPMAPRSGPNERTAPRKAVPARSAAIKPAAVSAASCTQEIAAVGLCTAVASDKLRAPAAASAPQEAPRQGAVSCEEGVAALGLCAPASNKGKE